MSAAAIEAVARAIAANKMSLIDGLRLPDELWRQVLPEAKAAYLASLRAIRERMEGVWVNGTEGIDQLIAEAESDA